MTLYELTKLPEPELRAHNANPTEVNWQIANKDRAAERMARALRRVSLQLGDKVGG